MPELGILHNKHYASMFSHWSDGRLPIAEVGDPEAEHLSDAQEVIDTGHDALRRKQLGARDLPRVAGRQSEFGGDEARRQVDQSLIDRNEPDLWLQAPPMRRGADRVGRYRAGLRW